MHHTQFAKIILANVKFYFKTLAEPFMGVRRRVTDVQIYRHYCKMVL